jgi:hypothetical protein
LHCDYEEKSMAQAKTLHRNDDVGRAPEKPKKELDKELDKALEDSFPASDPPGPSQPTGTEPAGDPKVRP